MASERVANERKPAWWVKCFKVVEYKLKLC